MVERKLLRVLEAAGLEVIDATGSRSTPTLHEALMTAPTEATRRTTRWARCSRRATASRAILLRPARVQVRKYGGLSPAPSAPRDRDLHDDGPWRQRRRTSTRCSGWRRTPARTRSRRRTASWRSSTTRTPTPNDPDGRGALQGDLGGVLRPLGRGEAQAVRPDAQVRRVRRLRRAAARGPAAPAGRRARAGRARAAISFEDLGGMGGLGRPLQLHLRLRQAPRPGRRRGRSAARTWSTRWRSPSRSRRAGASSRSPSPSPRAAPPARARGSAPGTTPVTCPECKGSGTVTFGQGGFAVTRPCPACYGPRAPSPPSRAPPARARAGAPAAPDPGHRARRGGHRLQAAPLRAGRAGRRRRARGRPDPHLPRAARPLLLARGARPPLHGADQRGPGHPRLARSACARWTGSTWCSASPPARSRARASASRGRGSRRAGGAATSTCEVKVTVPERLDEQEEQLMQDFARAAELKY